jgi:LysM repeat protein
MLLKTIMNFRFFPLIALLTTFSLSSFAHNIVSDSVGVENQNGKKVILHKLDPKDNFYSIGRRYNINPKVIIDYNKGAKMSIGEVIKVPTSLPFNEQPAARITPQSKPVTQATPAYTTPVQKPVVNTPPAQQQQPGTTQYKVSAGETLYAISKRFNTTVEDITTLNGLKSTSLTPGQIILVRSAPAPAEKPVEKPVEKPIASTPAYQQPPITAKRDSTIVSASDSVDSMGHRILRSGNFGLYEKNEKGVALWIEDADLDPNKKLILHRTAPIGTVIKITNPMTNRTTFAKVVGRINDNESNKDAVVVMTKSVADALGALDKRFHVNLSYGSPNE